jgi:hypothetical protein
MGAWGRALSVLLFLCSGAAAQPSANVNEGRTEPAGERPAIAIELNKLEPGANTCHAYFIVSNRTAEPLKDLQLDVYLFDKKGVILRSLRLPFADVGPGRMKVSPFGLSELQCGNLGRVLVNDIPVCASPSGAPVKGCADMLAVSTRTDAAFVY